MNRREFLTTSGKTVCACAVGTGSLFFSNCSNPTEPSSPIDTTGIELDFNLTDDKFIPLQADGGSVVTTPNEVDSSGLLFFRSGETVKAFTRRCTHQGGLMNSFSGGSASCALHGAQFNTNGQHTSGPGEGSLKSYETLLDGNILRVFGG